MQKIQNEADISYNSIENQYKKVMGCQIYRHFFGSKAAEKMKKKLYSTLLPPSTQRSIQLNHRLIFF